MPATQPPPDLPPDPQGSGHLPVMLAETLAGLAVRPGGWYIDGTAGGGGHTRAILDASAPDGRVLSLDADPAAILRVGERLAPALAQGRLVLVQSQFEALAQVAAAQGLTPVDGILLDLGISSFQIDTPDRGFAFRLDGPLDMRFDPSRGESAADLLNSRSEQEIADLIYQLGEERRSRQIARAIVAARPITRTGELAEVVERAVGGRRGRRIHPATQTFQALRIAVNDELGQLSRTLPQALSLLKPGGRLAVITFHSLEDRIVKEWARDEARSYVPDPAHPFGGRERQPTLRLTHKKPIEASADEIAQNPRSRSARLRIVERI